MTIDLALLVVGFVGFLAGWASRWSWSERRWEEPSEDELPVVVDLTNWRRIP